MRDAGGLKMTENPSFRTTQKNISLFCSIPSVAHLQLPSSGLFAVNAMPEHRITSERVPAGRGMPTWLLEAFQADHDPGLLVVHPNEAHRQQTLQRLHANGSTSSPQSHTTMNQLLRLLHVDFRLPVMLNDDVTNFMGLHRKCSEAAEAFAFPLLHTPGVGRWSMQKTKRLLALYAEVSSLRSPFSWSANPGVDVIHRLMLTYELDMRGTLPALLPYHVLQALNEAQEPPFHFSSLNGVILLDMAPDFSEIEQDIMMALSVHCPIHQLIHPGSFRLGHHGAYLVDEPPRTSENLPPWVPPHVVWSGSGDSWSTMVGESRQQTLTRVTLDHPDQLVDAAVQIVHDFLQHQGGRILVLDGQARQRQGVWAQRFSQLGIMMASTTTSLEGQPVHSALIHAAGLGQGMDAWSLNSLRTAISSKALPWANDMFPSVQHPSQPEWRPTPHLDVLTDMAQHFHVLGGPGAIGRWLGALSQAQPSLMERHPEQRRKKLEETQWWLACLLRSWTPLLLPEDRFLADRPHIGCSSGALLTVPTAPANGLMWLSQTVQRLNIDRLSEPDARFNRGMGDLHDVLEAVSRVAESEGSEGLTGTVFIDVLHMIGESLRISTVAPQTSDVAVLTPEEAHGCEADAVVLAGLDVQSWPMKHSVVPWLDSSAQLELGVFHNDALVRQGRHHLRHALNAGRFIWVLDTSPAEDAGPSAPLAEWLTEVRRSGALSSMHNPPSYVPPSRYQGLANERCWDWVARESGKGAWLTPLAVVHSNDEHGPYTRRTGPLPRNRQQSTGHNLQRHRTEEASVLNPRSLVQAHEAPLVNDRYRRQPTAKRLETGDYLAWGERTRLVGVEALNFGLLETKQLATPSVNAAEWPHLGFRPERRLSIGVDPRPLPPYALAPQGLIGRMGRLSASFTRSRWSPSRLEKVLKCPRQAWADTWLEVNDDEATPSEDVDNRTRGQLVHDLSVALMEGHGLEVTVEEFRPPLPLHLGAMNTLDLAWSTALEFLSAKATWLGRSNAVSVHRTRALLNATADDWEHHMSGAIELPIGGQLGAMVTADWGLTNAAPLVVEWPARQSDDSPVLIDAVSEHNESLGFEMFGYADRVDMVVLPQSCAEQLAATGVLSDEDHDAPFPLDGTPRSAQRLIIVRDLKTVNGPKVDRAGVRHARCLFEELQLALYARAWEVTHPNDRVVGIGATEIGERTVHYVELDEDLDAVAPWMSIGEVTDHLRGHFPAPEGTGAGQTAFRRWMSERLKVAQRAIDSMAEGHVNATPGRHCSYCSLKDACDVAEIGGER